MALIARQPRTADVLARGPARVLALEWAALDRVARYYPRIASLLFRNLSAVVGNRLVVNEGAKGQVITDDLSGAYSMSYFTRQLGAEIARMRRHGGPLTLAVLSLDPSAGRPPDPQSAGTALRSLASAIRTTTRPTDVASRRTCCILLLLPHTDEAHALQVTARIRRACMALPGWLEGLVLHTDIIPVRPADDPETVLARLEAQPQEGAAAQVSGAEARDSDSLTPGEGEVEGEPA